VGLELHHFREVTTEIGEPGPGQVLCRIVLLSIDPANRAWMQGRTYRDQLSRGEVMAGFTLGEVIAGDLPSGAVVACEAGWQEYVVLSTAAVRPVTVRGELSHYLGALGVNGPTAYFGLLEIGRPRPGETVVVSGAAGATGHLDGQIAQLTGCRIVGIAGSADKTRLLTEQLGFEAAVNERGRVVCYGAVSQYDTSSRPRVHAGYPAIW